MSTTLRRTSLRQWAIMVEEKELAIMVEFKEVFNQVEIAKFPFRMTEGTTELGSPTIETRECESIKMAERIANKIALMEGL